MPKLRIKLLLPLSRFIALCCAMCAFAVPASCQQPAPSENASTDLQSDPVLKAWGENSEVRKCGICHFSTGNAFAKRDTDFCQLEEAKIWLQSDKHAVSRLRIEPLSRDALAQKGSATPGNILGESNFVSYMMCQKLGYDLATKGGYDKFRDNCLTCHAGYDPKQQSSSEDFTNSNTSHLGITCNYCHQLGDTSRWVDLHSTLSSELNWRLLSPHHKETAGMRDLVDAQSQAKLCSACHIGDLERKMFITHDMYVAGHPPLPSFELQTYLSNLPPHWRDFDSTYASLKNFSKRDEYFAINLSITKEHVPRAMADTFWETRTMLLGAIKAAEQSIALMADADAHQHWGDFALYDCASCHHELRIPNLRQKRATHEVPGRPRLSEWPTRLVEVALQLTSAENGVREAHRDLLKLVNQTPFGNPNDCIPVARELTEALKKTGVQLAKSGIHADDARLIVKLLAQTAEDSLLDYQTTRQIIWAIQLVDRELASKGHSLPDACRASIQGLGNEDQQPLVSTNLPSGRSGTLYSPVGTEQLSYLAKELQRMRAYDPMRIQIQLKALCSQLD